MKRILINGLAFLVIFSCVPEGSSNSYDDTIIENNQGNESGNGQEGNGDNSTIEPAPEGFANIGVSIQLPEDTSYNANELYVSSLFTEKEFITNEQGVAQIFDGNEFELIYATNANDDIVLMGFLNPSKTKNVILNAETTASAMVMLHPWTMHLSVSTKEEAILAIKELPAFTPFLDEVANMIAGGILDFEKTNAILLALNTLQSKMSDKFNSSKSDSPLTISYQEKKVRIQNAKSSMVYGLRLYDENETPVGEPIYTYGVNKTILSISNIVNIAQGNFDIFQSSASVDVPILENGNYVLKAKSGLSFDDTSENEGAALRNSLELISNIIGIFSSTMGSLVKKASCGISIGTWAYGKLKTGISLVLQNKKTPKEFLSEAIIIIGENSAGLYDIVKACAKVPKNAFTEIFKAIGILSNLENGVTTSLNIFDWLNYEKEIEFCANLNSEQSNIVDCIDIEIVEPSLSFGSQKIDTKSYKNMTIVNKGEDLVFTMHLGIPGSTSSNPNYGVWSNTYGFNYCLSQNQVSGLCTIDIAKGETKQLLVEFEPRDVKNYVDHSFYLQVLSQNGNPVSRSDRDKITLTGTGIE